MPPTLADTYFAMLERPSLRQIGAVDYDFIHQTDLFSKEIYEGSVRSRFSSREDAYLHWLTVGRRMGAEWSCGRDTTLKIILKAKDEPHLIDGWMKYHSEIVGYENIIVIDCGSQDPGYLQKLRRYKSRSLTFSYERFYDNLHSTRTNRKFYEFVRRNCRYVTVLDADEFLVGRQDGKLSKSFVKSILKRKNLQLYCGIWLNSVGPSIPSDLVFSGRRHVSVDLRLKQLLAGARAGKAIASTEVLFDIGHLGHNLPDKNASKHVTERSFGDIFVLHLKNLEAKYRRSRALNHLLSRGLIVNGPPESLQRQARTLALAPSTRADIGAYALACLEESHAHTEDSPSESTSLSVFAQDSVENADALNQALARVDFPSLLSTTP